jgi:hypothetical protein
MPEQIRDAINAARAGGSGSVTDPTWRDRLAERFGPRWRIIKPRARKGGSASVDPTQGGTTPCVPKGTRTGSGGGGGGGGTGGTLNTGSKPDSVAAAKTKVAGSIPAYIAVTGDEIDEDGILASWMPNHPDHPEGAVLIKIDHPVLKDKIEYWQAQYPDHLADQIADEVIAVYGEIAVAKVAHSEYMKSVMPSSKVEQELRSDAALTMALLGLIGEEAVIAPRVGGKVGRSKAA